MKLSELLNERKGDRSYEALERDCAGERREASPGTASHLEGTARSSRSTASSPPRSRHGAR